MARSYARDNRGRFAATGTRTRSRNPQPQQVKVLDSSARSVALVRGKGVAGRVRAFRLNGRAKKALAQASARQRAQAARRRSR